MVIHEQTGKIQFSNLTVHEDKSIDAAHTVDVELWMSNGSSKTYRYTNVSAEQNQFIVLAVFHDDVLNRVSVSIDHPGQTWEDETPEQIEADCSQLQIVVQQSFGRLADKYVFEWGKVERFRDAKNALMCSLVVTYLN